MIKMVSAEPNTVILKLDLIILNLFSTKKKFMVEKNKVIIIIMSNDDSAMESIYKSVSGVVQSLYSSDQFDLLGQDKEILNIGNVLNSIFVNKKEE